MNGAPFEYVITRRSCSTTPTSAACSTSSSEPLAISSEFPWHGSKFSPQPSSSQSQKLSPQLLPRAALVLASRLKAFSVHVTLRSMQVPFGTFRVKSHQDTSNMYHKFRCSTHECTTRSTNPTMGYALPSGHWILTLPSK